MEELDRRESVDREIVAFLNERDGTRFGVNFADLTYFRDNWDEFLQARFNWHAVSTFR